MSHVLECAEVNGKLPRICGGFAIETAVVLRRVLRGQEFRHLEPVFVHIRSRRVDGCEDRRLPLLPA